MKNRNLALLAVLLAALLGGGLPTMSKIGLREIPPLSFIFIRFGLSLLFLFPLFLKEKPRLTKATLPVILVSLLATLNIVLFTFGIRNTTATTAQMLYVAVPIIAVLFSRLLIKEKITLKKMGGITLGLVGTLSIVLLPILGLTDAIGGSLGGNLMILAGVTSFAIYSVFSKKLQERYSPQFLTLSFSLTTAAVSLAIAITETASYSRWWAGISLGAWLAVAYVGVIGTAAYYLLYQYAIKQGTPVTASMTFYLQPAATFVWSAILLGERVTVGFALGAILALSGAWLTTKSK